MTIEEVKNRVAQIVAIRGDDEVAHGKEDDLWRDVLRHIADGGAGARELAIEALTTLDIEFERWCA